MKDKINTTINSAISKVPGMAPPLPQMPADDLRKYRRQNLIVLVLFLAGLSCFGYIAFKAFRAKRASVTEGDLACVKESIPISPNDQRMSGLLHPRDHLTVLSNYFNCNPVVPGELVYLKVAENIQPVVRIVRGVPGDRYEVDKVPGKSDHWQVKINGQVVKTKDGDLELVSKFDPALRTYQLSRQGILRANEYLLFSNVSPSLEDSSDLGLISRDRILGRVFKE